MMYIDFEAGDKAYKLRLSTRAIVALEKKIGCNPLSIFGVDGEQIPTVTTMVCILHSSLQKYHHDITEAKAMDIFDEWLEEGHTSTEFVNIILDIYKASGIVPKEINEEGTEKN